MRVEISKAKGVAVVRPDNTRTLSETDFQKLADRVDKYLQDHDALHGLVVVAAKFPGWDGFKAFAAHIRFIRDHHRAIGKVAVVSDSQFLSLAPHLAKLFVHPKVRHFASADLKEAKGWAALEEAHSGRFVVLEGFGDDVVAVEAEGLITRGDYLETLIPAVGEKIAAKGKIKLLFWCGPRFEGFSAGALWSDARFGLTNWRNFSRIAVVSDVGWICQAAKLFAPLMRAPVRVFGNAKIEDAKGWISGD